MAGSRSALKGLLRMLAWPCALIPARLRIALLKGLIVLDSRIGSPAGALRRQFAIADMVNTVIAERATAYGGGEHPKHRLMRYHDFFIEHVEDGERVLDVGCGYGAVARSIARARPGAEVLGIELDAPRLQQAQSADNPPNLTFVHGDVLVDLPAGRWDVVVLSNVLEHIEHRVDFLKRLQRAVTPRRILVRVPLFERDWHVPMRKELGVGYFSDSTHFIEHTLEEFAEEAAAAGLDVAEQRLLWGEIWAVLTPSGGS